VGTGQKVPAAQRAEILGEEPSIVEIFTGTPGGGSAPWLFPEER
jgi:hypothetical protein